MIPYNLTNIAKEPDHCHVCSIKIVTHYYISMSNALEILWRYHDYVLTRTHFVHQWPFVWESGPWFNIKMTSYQYRKSHCVDKTVVRSSYLHNGISYTGKMSSLYWIGALSFTSGFPAQKASNAELWCFLFVSLNNLSFFTLLMLETEYPSFGAQYHACWCPGSLSHQGISRHGIDSIGYATYRIAQLQICQH